MSFDNSDGGRSDAAINAARAMARQKRSLPDEERLGHVVPLDGSDFPVAADLRFTSPTWVYRYFTEDATLAYVGMSNSPLRRDLQHWYSWPGRRHLAFMRTDLFPERQLAALVEDEAIRKERPYAHKPGNYRLSYHGRAGEWFVPGPSVWLSLARAPDSWRAPQVIPAPF